MIDWDKPIQTKDGAPARVLSRDFVVGGEPCIAVQIDRDGYSYLCTFGIGADASVGEDALRNVKVKREAWVLVSPKYGIVNRMQIYRTEDQAREAAMRDEVVCRLTWEE